MIVYIESNFVLELALGQEQAIFADAILKAAEAKKIELAFPSFALSEPFTTVMHRRGERRRQYDAFLKMLDQIKRSEAFKKIALDVEQLIDVLKQAQKNDFDPLHATIERMLAIGRVIEITTPIFQQALTYQTSLDLSPQDSIIYSSIVSDLAARVPDEEKCFISRDKKAFFGEDIRSEESDVKDKLLSKSRIRNELKKYHCRYISTFDDGLKFITSKT